jgi:hypothetical protein
MILDEKTTRFLYITNSMKKEKPSFILHKLILENGIIMQLPIGITAGFFREMAASTAIFYSKVLVKEKMVVTR